MYDYKIYFDGIETEVSFHPRLTTQLQKINERKANKYCEITKDKMLKMLLSYGESILEFKNDTEFVVIDSDLKIGFCCSIYTTGFNLEIEITELKQKRTLPKGNISLIIKDKKNKNETYKVVI